MRAKVAIVVVSILLSIAGYSVGVWILSKPPYSVLAILVLSALIGWSTNKLVVWLMFRPYKPLPSENRPILWGVIPSRKKLLASNIAFVIANKLFGREELINILKKVDFDAIFSRVKLDELKKNEVVNTFSRDVLSTARQIVKNLDFSEIAQNYRHRLLERVYQFLSSKEFTDSLFERSYGLLLENQEAFRKKIWQLIYERVTQVEKDQLERLIIKILRSEKLKEHLRDLVCSSFDWENFEKVAEFLMEFEGEFKNLFKKSLKNLMKRLDYTSLRDKIMDRVLEDGILSGVIKILGMEVWNMFSIEDKIRDALTNDEFLDSISEEILKYLKKRENQKVIYESLTKNKNLLVNKVIDYVVSGDTVISIGKKFSEKLYEQRGKIAEEMSKLFTRLVFERLDDQVWMKERFYELWYEVLLEKMKGYAEYYIDLLLADKKRFNSYVVNFLDNDELWKKIEAAVDSLMDKVLDKGVKFLRNDEGKRLILNFISQAEVVDKLRDKIELVVREKIERFDEQRLEELVMETVEKELEVAVLLGIPLGLVIGVVQITILV